MMSNQGELFAQQQLTTYRRRCPRNPATWRREVDAAVSAFQRDELMGALVACKATGCNAVTRSPAALCWRHRNLEVKP
jgi:hypothetical protein